MPDNISTFLGTGEDPRSPLRVLSDNWETIVDHIHLRWNTAQQEVRALLGPDYPVDEMAIYFPDDRTLRYFIRRIVRRGWVLFNTAEDEVETSPIRALYGVEYWFLSHPQRSYRLELMRVTDGYSPYHGSLEYAAGLGVAPISLAHASFKVPDEAAYATANLTLRQAGWLMAQQCTSTYGRFSYHIDVERYVSGSMPPLKPRLNTRDGGADSGQ